MQVISLMAELNRCDPGMVKKSSAEFTLVSQKELSG